MQIDAGGCVGGRVAGGGYLRSRLCAASAEGAADFDFDFDEEAGGSTAAATTGCC
jgi:hypothetical protein